ncbi:MAG: CRTAC1 family protein [Thermoanaerobaculia bacterium]|nr:CRTAC1 family protein [Thermoanaerobaculia bacterium]
MIGLASQSGPAHAEPPFADVAQQVGIDHVYRNGMDGSMHLVEITGGGVALFDYDGDGDLDLYATQGHSLKRDRPPGPVRQDRLFRNELIGPSSDGSLRFVDVTEVAGIRSRGYGMGVATGDYDDDGDLDLYVTNFGPNQLWRNEGDGTFRDVTAAAGSGVGDAGWSVAATFVDLDGDGRLDLYVGNYVEASIENPKTCRAATGELDYCGPLAYRPASDRLLRNQGDGTFLDVTRSAGLTVAAAGLGVGSGDFDGDGRIDLFVANDGMANQLWLNRTEPVQNGRSAKIRLEDDALFAGLAFNVGGQPEASMGVASGDVNGDGLDDLLITHLLRETHTLYLSRGGGAFLDATGQSGLAAPSWMMTGFGTAFLDYDLDGDLDLLVANGAVTNFDRNSLSAADVEHWILAEGEDRPGWRLHQPNQIFRNETVPGSSKIRFVDLGREAGDLFRRAEVSRGLGVGDLDNDGDPDAVIVNVEGPLRLLKNRSGDGKGWIGVRALGAAAPGGKPRDLYGSRVGLRLADGSYRWRTVRSDGSYASASDPRILFATVGVDDSSAGAVRVVWPDGVSEDYLKIRAGRYTDLIRGNGLAVTMRGVAGATHP